MVKKGSSFTMDGMEKGGDGIVTEFPDLKNTEFEEKDRYPINEPYSYVRILYNKETYEYFYHSIEPSLSEDENRLLKFLSEEIVRIVEYGKKDENQRDYIDGLVDKLIKENEIRAGCSSDPIPSSYFCASLASNLQVMQLVNILFGKQVQPMICFDLEKGITQPIMLNRNKECMLCRE